MTTQIYMLVDDSKAVRYIGKTVSKLRLRLNMHVWESKSGAKNHKCNWVRSMLDRGLSPVIQLIETVGGDGFKEEIEMIAFFRANNASLTNSTIGGDGACGTTPSEETRLKMSLAGMGKKRSPETCMRIRIAKTGLCPSDATRKKISDANTGRVPSLETRQKLSRSLTGRPVSMETRIKLRASNVGKRRSPEAIGRMRLAQAGKSHSKETRIKMSNARMGKKLSVETRNNMRAAWVIRRMNNHNNQTHKHYAN